MMENYDVIIVGGGLAGLSLAIQLADKNRKVLLIEKNKYPFHKVCGEYISMESWDFLERLGLPLSTYNLPIITQLKISTITGNDISTPLDLGGFGISRYKLDYELAEIAKNKGVVLFDGTVVTDVQFENDLFSVHTKDKIFESKVVAGAFGKRSNLDKKLNRSFDVKPRSTKNNWVGVKYHIQSDLILNEIQLHNFNGGYCGFSKVEDKKYCLCYLTKAENLKKYNGNIKLMEDELLSQNPFLKKIFADRSKFLFIEPETIAQITFETKRAVEQNIIMLGDAAGMIAPLFGNGMSMALRASSIAFPVINNFLEHKISRSEMEQEYLSRWNKEFSIRLKTGRLLQPLLVKSALSNISIPFLKLFPFILKRIIKNTHGKSF